MPIEAGELETFEFASLAGFHIDEGSPKSAGTRTSSSEGAQAARPEL